MISFDEMAAKTRTLRETLADAKARRLPEAVALAPEVEVMAVSKFQPIEAIVQARKLGFTIFGENRPQELRDKLQDDRLTDYCFDLIGTLQKNKLKYIVGKIRLIQSVDNLELLEALSSYAERLGLIQDILLEVNYSGEVTKHGFSGAELPQLLDKIGTYSSVRACGLMTMAEPGLDETAAQDFFRRFADFFRQCQEALKTPERRAAFTVLSMGMSDDFVPAVLAGANCIRIGRGIFGSRP